jgi:hypothetical protein
MWLAIAQPSSEWKRRNASSATRADTLRIPTARLDRFSVPDA